MHPRLSNHLVALTRPSRTDATWALGRISSQTKLANQDVRALTYTYNYDSTAGGNTDVYMIGTRAE